MLRMTATSNQLGADFVTRRMLRLLKMEFNPPFDSIRYPDGSRSACCVSIDFDATRPGRDVPNHIGTYALVELSEKYHLPMTWAVCGKTADDDRDAYERILGSSSRHEIGVHTYSHVDASRCSARELELEITRCLESIAISPTPRTFIFPWNREAHFEVLRRMGFIAYRGAKREITRPRKKRGLWNVPPVFYLDEKSEGAASLIKRFVDLCIECRSVFHLWLHPWSVASENAPLPLVSNTLDPVFEYLARKRNEGLLGVSTIGDLARSFENTLASASASAQRMN